MVNGGARRRVAGAVSVVQTGFQGVGTATAQLQLTPPLAGGLVDQTSDSTRRQQMASNRCAGEGQSVSGLHFLRQQPISSLIPSACSHPPTFSLCQLPQHHPSTSPSRLSGFSAPAPALLPSVLASRTRHQNGSHQGGELLPQPSPLSPRAPGWLAPPLDWVHHHIPPSVPLDCESRAITSFGYSSTRITPRAAMALCNPLHPAMLQAN